MVALTVSNILSKARVDDLSAVRSLNVWGLGLSDVSVLSSVPNVEVLSLSVNRISSLAPFANCRLLKELYLRNNTISSLDELDFLLHLKNLRVLWLSENPVCQHTNNYRLHVINALPQLLKLDDREITPDERQKAQQLFSANQESSFKTRTASHTAQQQHNQKSEEEREDEDEDEEEEEGKAGDVKEEQLDSQSQPHAKVQRNFQVHHHQQNHPRRAHLPQPQRRDNEQLRRHNINHHPAIGDEIDVEENPNHSKRNGMNQSQEDEDDDHDVAEHSADAQQTRFGWLKSQQQPPATATSPNRSRRSPNASVVRPSTSGAFPQRASLRQLPPDRSISTARPPDEDVHAPAPRAKLQSQSRPGSAHPANLAGNRVTLQTSVLAAPVSVSSVPGSGPARSTGASPQMSFARMVTQNPDVGNGGASPTLPPPAGQEIQSRILSSIVSLLDCLDESHLQWLQREIDVRHAQKKNSDSRSVIQH